MNKLSYKTLRKFLFATAMLAGLYAPLSAQISIPKAKFHFDFPNKSWEYLETLEIDKNTNMYVYSGVPLVSAKNDTTLPFLRIYVKNNIGDENSLDYSLRRFMQQPFIIVDEFSESPYLPCKDAIGYIGIYKDNYGNRCEFYMLYFVHKNTLVEFRLETTEESFEDKRAEFEEIMESITLD